MPFLDLPPIDWTPILELRARYERRTDRDFNRSNVDNTSDILSRFRIGTEFASGKIRGKLLYQYAHNEEWSRRANFSQWRSDFVLAYAQTKTGRASVTAGRQRLSFGSERLLGAAEWNNASNSWDGIRVGVGKFEGFAAKVGVGAIPNNDVALFGGTYTQGPHQTLLVYKRDVRDTQVDEVTISQLYRAALGKFKIDAEAAGQFGRRDGRRKQAGALDVIVAMPVAPKLSLSLQGSIASGGDPSGTNATFDQLYPSLHDKHGLIDAAGWKNIRDLALWLRYEPDKLTSVKLQYHRLALDSARDAFYGGNGRPNSGRNGVLIDPTGRSGRGIGDEFDVDMTRRLNPHQTVRAGVGVLNPGPFVRALNGGDTRSHVWGYVQWAYNF